MTEAWSFGSTVGLEEVFANLGTLLATLHADRELPRDAPPATKRPFEVVRKMANSMVVTDETIRQVRAWAVAPRGGEETPTFVHGNLRLDNLILTRGRIGFVDFESCGSGPRYQDLSRPATHLLLLRVSLAVPAGRMNRALTAFLQAYEAVSPYDSAVLSEWVAVRLARYYLESHRRNWPGLIAGLPVVRVRLAALIRCLMENGPDALPGAAVRRLP